MKRVAADGSGSLIGRNGDEAAALLRRVTVSASPAVKVNLAINQIVLTKGKFSSSVRSYDNLCAMNGKHKTTLVCGTANCIRSLYLLAVL